MPTLTYAAALLLCAGALAAGLLISWAHFRLRTAARFVALAAHREELLSLRRRYRRRLRAMRDAASRHRINENELRRELRVATDHQATQGKLMTGAQAEISTLRERITDMDQALRSRDESLAGSRSREQSLAAELCAATGRLAAFERDHGLIRIERDELLAQTERLRALPLPVSDAVESATATAAPEAPVAPRAELADRDSRIHELECQLRESAGRMTELETSLQTWKYRIAPLAMHMKNQRDRALAARTAKLATAAGPARPDDLKRIRGIGRGLEKKLCAEGITGFARLAAMSPAELANLAVRVGVAASRPQRDGWAEQARNLGGTGTDDALACQPGRAETA